MDDKEFLQWIRDRIVNVYHESPNVDFIHRLDKIIASMDTKDVSNIDPDWERESDGKGCYS